MSFYERHESKFSLVGIVVVAVILIYLIMPHEIAVALVNLFMTGLEGLSYIKG